MGLLADTWVAIDPGPDCGVALWHRYPTDKDTYHPNAFHFYTWSLDGRVKHTNPDHLWLLHKKLSETVYDSDTLIYEKFHWQPEVANNSPKIDIRPAEYGGVIEIFGINQGKVIDDDLIIQSPAQAVGDHCFWDNWKLRALGLYKPGKDQRHEMDALRHLLFYAMTKANDQKLLLWLKERMRVVGAPGIKNRNLDQYHD